MTPVSPEKSTPFGSPFEEVLQSRIREADEFYKTVISLPVGSDAANVIRQALSGMLAPEKREHVLGTDRFGRDILSRVVWAGQTSLPIVLVSVAIGVLFGVSVGF